MKITLCLAALAIALVVVQGEPCRQFDTSQCTSTTCSGTNSVVICEHDECTCGAPCKLASDCNQCNHNHNDPHFHEEAHCVDGGCVCGPAGGHQPPPGGN